ncbi:family 43 glycosylhydrolase [Cellulomonas marina]|uniref:Glycosyl hydrolases family 43 n=1 Tax=Cellulomonas marina TaxID=988821 RepID=A0A1I0Y071_9CELL|nr:family 43 glycosylhydrolase [Cellulomonas marina]GIG28418.1 hypothetical protein Cma02nite_10180 [Cellulomonas marina]SFB06749.1 Glycosyl hydrolases family 43 [Cellulomonas marina]
MRRPARPALLTAAVALGAALVAPTAAAAPGPTVVGDGPLAPTATTYTNPVSDTFADTYADPAVIRGQDGWWYAYGTTDPLREGEGTRHLLPMSRSQDLVDWEYVGDAFTETTLPSWADTAGGTALWAPDIRYVDGEYRLYYVVTDTTVTGERGDGAIGVATAPTPTGPWTAAGGPVVGPRRGAGGPGDFLWTFDPHHVATPDGEEHLFYGSYYGGIFVTELSDDGTRAVGTPTRVAIDNKFEGAYVVQRDGWWYLFASTANCCAGPTTGYSVQVGRSRDLTGPYVDREGVPLDQSRAGGTPVLFPNGNAFVGTGHNAITTDLAGQDWIVYHAIDRADPYLDGTDGINERPMLIDRLDWVDGWPVVRGGLGGSDDAQPGPVTGGRAVTGFDAGLPDGRGTTALRAEGAWATATDVAAGPYAASTGAATLLTRGGGLTDVRVEADVRRAAGSTASTTLAAAVGGRGTTLQAANIRARLEDDALVVETTATVRGRTAVTATQSAPLPHGFQSDAWHALVLEVRDGQARAELSHARLGDPLAEVVLDLPRGTRTHGAAGVLVDGPGAHVDDVSVLPAAVPVTDVVEPPAPGPWDPALGDEFDGDTLASGWTAVRDPQVRVEDGSLVWPTEAKDLTGDSDDAGLLLRDAPEGDWVAETRLTIDLGVEEIRNYQQGGIVAYVDDDDFARLSHVAIWNTRQTEFGREIPFAGGTRYGGTIVGPPAETTWLRLTRTADAAGEQEVRASTSTDGITWVHGGTWTFDAGAEVRIGLVAHGGAGATARFDHLRVAPANG